jgi:hypothetical protein
MGLLKVALAAGVQDGEVSMSNILEQEDYIKGLPDSELQRMVEQPNGQIPDFLPLSEIQRRTDMREKYAATEQPQMRSVRDNIMAQGLASAAPQRSSTPPDYLTSALPAGGGMQGQGGMGVQGYNTGGVIRMQDGRRAPRPQTGASNMVAAVDAATNMLRAQGRDASIYSQAELRRMGEEILGANTGPTLLQQGYKESRPDLGSDYNIDSVSSYRLNPFATPPVVDRGIELAGDAKDSVVDAAGNVVDYFREDEQLGILGEVVSGGYGLMKDAAGSGLDYVGDKYDSVSDAYNSSFMATPVTELFRNPFDSTRNDEFAADHGYDMQGLQAIINRDAFDTSASDGNIPPPYGYNTISSMYPLGGALSGAYDYFFGEDEEADAVEVAETVETADAVEVADAVVDTPRNAASFLADLSRQQQVNPRFDQGRMSADAVGSISSRLNDEFDALESGQASESENLESLIESTRANAKKQAFYLGMMALGAGISKGDMGEGMDNATEVAGETLARGEGRATPLEAALATAPTSGIKDRIEALTAMARADANYRQIQASIDREGTLSDRNKNDLLRAIIPVARDFLEEEGVYSNSPDFNEKLNSLMSQFMSYSSYGAPTDVNQDRPRDAITSFDLPE